MICPNCGNDMPEGSLFCNKCGKKLKPKNNNTKTRHIFKNKKVFIPILIICCLVIITGVIYFIIKPPSTDNAYNKIKNYNSKDVINYLNKTYPENGGFLGLFKKKNKEAKSQVLTMMVKHLNNEFKNDTGRSISDYNAVKITNVSISDDDDADSDYENINITVNNGGKVAVNYIKINLYFKDENGNIIKSDWTNDDSCIQPGADQTLTKMVEKNSSWQTVNAQIAEIK